MRPTRQWWAIAGVGGVLLVIAVLGRRPLALTGAASIGALCLVVAVRAVTAFTTAQEVATVDIDISPSRVTVNGDATLSITVSLARPVSHPVTLEGTFPASVTSDSLTLSIAPGEREAREVVSPTFPVAGRFDVPNLVYVFESPDGLFTQRLPLDDRVTVTVDAESLDSIHIGESVDQIHEARGGNRGVVEFGSIRKYTPEEPARRIDWKTSARLGDLYVREYESDDLIDTRLIVDARSRLAEGESGRTKLDFLREVALGILSSAEAAGNPIGITIVDSEGMLTNIEPAATDDHYRRAREQLLTLEAESERQPKQQRRPAAQTASVRKAQTAYRRLAEREGKATRFEATLQPFFTRTGSYFARLSGDSLFETVRQQLRETSGQTWTVLLTDDEDPGNVEEIAALATRGDRTVTVFIAPTVLFERTGFADLESAYNRLVAFEEFRRRLTQIPGVAAYEVGPHERIRALLAQA